MNVPLTSLCDIIFPLRSKVKHVNTASIPVSVCIFISLKTWSDTLSDIQTNNTVCKKKPGHVIYLCIYFLLFNYLFWVFSKTQISVAKTGFHTLSWFDFMILFS